MSPSTSVSKTSDHFTPLLSPDAAMAFDRCLYEAERSLDFVNFFETDIPSSPTWRQENGVLVPVTIEKLMQYMLEWDVAVPNCLCPLQDPSSALVQMNLRQGKDGKWRFLCSSDFCGYEVDLSKVFGPGLPQTALQNYAIGSQDVENMEYQKYEERCEEYHGQPWNMITHSPSDIEKGPEDVSDYKGGRYSSRVPEAEKGPSENNEGTSQTSKVPAIDLAATEKKRPAKVQPMLRAYKKLCCKLDAQPAPAGKEKEVPAGTVVKALMNPPPAPAGQDKEVQVRAQASVALAAPAATQVPAVTTQDIGIQTIAAGNIRAPSLIRETAPMLRKVVLWNHLSLDHRGLTGEEFDGP
ncbi:uncharacterized protein ARMOST_20788 [Armillaria ostoyae]|uniref:Uncharacterized protein n=1 Tax=Armillaria ostoyae TaxID=47428 RepID=A0A284S890_ARMOS|nr:uncharacterized protein ARMOST_20788 [Armillaria ostoyae]